MAKRTSYGLYALKHATRLPALNERQVSWIFSQEKGRATEEYGKTHKMTDNHSYYCFVTTYKGWQVLRYFLIHSTYTEKRKDGGQDYWYEYLVEVAQRWICEDNGSLHLVNVEKPMTMSWYYHNQPYALWNPFTTKEDGVNTRTRFSMGDMEIYPHRVFADFSVEKGIAQFLARWDSTELVRSANKGDLSHYITSKYNKGMKLSKAGCYPISPMAMPNKVETLYKTRENELAGLLLAKGAYGNLVEGNWKSILVAKRHGYKPTSWRAWLDYVRDLAYLGLDIHSPKYLCPANLEQEHARLSARIARRREQIRIEGEKKNIAEFEPIYAETKGNYLDLLISNKHLDIKPLQSVQEFYEEGEAMHHCVYKCGYYKPQHNALILSAKDKEGKRVETIEVNLTNYKIIQSRGVCNKPTDRHNEIVKLINKNMDKIRALA